MTLKHIELRYFAEQQLARIVPGCTAVYGCPLAYEDCLLRVRFNLEEPSDTETASFSLVSRIDQTNEHHLKLMTDCLNSALHDLDVKSFTVARVGFTFLPLQSVSAVVFRPIMSLF